MKQYGMTILRVAVGGVYLMQAYLALFGSSPKGVATFIGKLGLPTPTLLAVVVIVVHGFGGGMLVVGLWTRVAAALNAALLLIGLLAVYVREGAVLKAPLVDHVIGRATGAGYEYLVVLLAATVALTAGGGGGGKSGRAK
jgi:putative oxidoreductase